MTKFFPQKYAEMQLPLQNWLSKANFQVKQFSELST